MSALEPPHPPQTPTAQLRVAAYVRYSSPNQRDGYSIPAQKAAIEVEAKARQARDEQVWRITWYEEPEESAKAEKIARRVVFARMMRDAHAGAYDLVVVHKFNRFARSLAHQLQFINELARDGVGFYCVDARTDYSTPQGRLMANILGSMAQYSSEDLGEEVKKGMNERAKLGLAWGSPPFGYRRATQTELAEASVTRLPFQPDTGPQGAWDGYQRIKALLLDGYSDVEVARRMNDEGRWGLSTVGQWPAGDGDGAANSANAARGTRHGHLFMDTSIRGIRINPFYGAYQPGDERGTVVIKGQRYRGAHRAAATWEEWRAMQDSAAQRRPRGGRPADVAARTPVGKHYARSVAVQWRAAGPVSEFSGIAVCASCGQRLYARRQVKLDAQGAVSSRYDRLYCPAARLHTPCADAGRIARSHDLTAAWQAWLATNITLPDGLCDLVTLRLQLRAHGIHKQTLNNSQPSAEHAAEGIDDDAHRVDLDAIARDIARWQERRRAAIELRLEALIDAREARARIAEVDRELARLSTLRETLSGGEEVYARRMREAAGTITALADTWGEMTPDERARAAALLIEPNGLRVKLLPNDERGAHRKNLAPDAHYAPIASVKLRGPFAELYALLSATREA